MGGKQKAAVVFRAVVVLASVVLASGCEGLFSSEGTIELTVQNMQVQESNGEKALEPAIDMEPVRYTITGTGASGSNFTLSTTSTSVTLTKLKSGLWTISVEAYNAQGRLIESGTASVTVSGGASTPVVVSVQPLTGTGALRITLTWPEGVIGSPAVTAVLVPVGEEDEIPPGTSTVGATEASLSWEGLPTGNYTLTVQLKDGDQVLASKTESVNILKDQTTSGSFTWDNKDELGGSLSIGITQDLGTPLTVTINGSEKSFLTLHEGESHTLIAEVEGGASGISYQWYVNGIPKGLNLNRFVIGGDWPAKDYGIDVIVVTSDGKKAGSASIDVKVLSLHAAAEWARTVSAGRGASQFRAVQVDAAGNVYAAGSQTGTGSCTYGDGVSVAGQSASSNALLVKYDASGTAQWARTVSGGTGASQFSSIAVDAAGDIYAAGYQEGTGQYGYGNGVSAAGTSAFNNIVLVKYDAGGKALWARTVSRGTGSSQLTAVAVDVAGNVYAAGWQEGIGTYTYGSGVSATGTCEYNNAVVVKYDTSGNVLWARTVRAGSVSAQFNGVALDAAGNVYAVGWQYGSGSYAYDSKANASATGSAYNAVLVKYNAAGTALWARTVSAGLNSSQFNGVVLDGAGNIYAGGWQEGTGTYTYGGGVSVHGTHMLSNLVLVKYDANGMAQWARSVYGGTDNTEIKGLAVDISGNIYAAGYQYGTGDYTFSTGVSSAGTSTSGNVMLIKYDASGTALWARTVNAGTRLSQFTTVAVDDAGYVYAAGFQQGTGSYIYEEVSVAGSSTSNNALLVKYLK